MKYNGGDLITIELYSCDAERLNNGQLTFLNGLRIIEHKPAPFDWSTVKPGMAFKVKYMDNCIVFYSGPSYASKEYKVCGRNREGVDYNSYHISVLTRAPQHDITIKV